MLEVTSPVIELGAELLLDQTLPDLERPFVDQPLWREVVHIALDPVRPPDQTVSVLHRAFDIP